MLSLVIACIDASTALTIAITGTNSGIGKAAASLLLKDGHTVYHACRTAEGAQQAVEAAGGGTTMVCDLADLSSVRSFAAALTEQAPDLDVLCLNSGVPPSRKAEAPRRTKDGFEETIGINHLGHYCLARLLHPLLERNGGRLVVTASGVHDPDSPGGTVQGDKATGATLGDLSGLGATDEGAPVMVDGAVVFGGAKAYHDSKLCNVLFAREAHRRWGAPAGGVSVRSFNPGLITDTGLFRAARRDNAFSTALFSFVATNLAGFSVPVEVGGARLAVQRRARSPTRAKLPPPNPLAAVRAQLASKSVRYVE